MFKINPFVLALIILVLFPLSLFSESGRIEGKVTDLETGAPVSYAMVRIRELALEARTDSVGMYLFINVPSGEYSVSAAKEGDQNLKVVGVKVYPGFSIEQDFSLPIRESDKEPFRLKTAEIEPIDYSEMTVITGKELEKLPLRDYAKIFNNQSGAVHSGDELHIRGGRSDEVGFYVDGVLMNHPYTRDLTGGVSASAIEEAGFQPGGRDASSGLFNSGVIQVHTKTGGSRLTITGEYITDGFLKSHEKHLGTYSYGYHLYNLSAGGPVPFTDDKLRFYANLEYLTMSDRNPTRGPTYKPDVFVRDVEELLALNPEPVEVYGVKPDNGIQRWTGTANLTYAWKDWRFRAGGHLDKADWNEYIHDFAPFNSFHNPTVYRDTYTLYGKAVWNVSPEAWLEAHTDYYLTRSETMDPVHGMNFIDYADPSKNDNFPEWGEIAEPREEFALFDTYGRVYDWYQKDKMERIHFRMDGSWMFGRAHTLSTGFEIQSNRIRYYKLDPYYFSWILHELTLSYGDWRNAPQEYVKQAYLYTIINNFGYDITGTEINEGNDAVRKPKVFSAYIEDHIEIPDGELRLGLRLDKINVGEKQLKDPWDITLDNNGYFADENFIGGPVFSCLSPRISLAFHWLKGNILRFHYGKYVEPQSCEYMLVNWERIAAGFT